ncbi:MAG TPA: PSP1 domain-containing protein, partial [Pirellulales bacterium]|nr:PSP1 domain-containing protein [Pirellulales bacterium]
VGAIGNVGRFTAVDAVVYPRGARVILRTSRGLEIGEVLSSAADAPPHGQSDGSIVRRMTIEDQLLEARLERNRQEAFAACAQRIRKLGLGAVLVDVEHLFDGRSLFFYFLGEVPAELEAVTAELAEVYDAAVQFRKFADTVVEGCGPGCGTADAVGGECKSCSTGCPIGSACGTPRK